MSQKLRIGTRGSQLAMTQTNMVATALRKAHTDLDVEIVDFFATPTGTTPGIGVIQNLGNFSSTQIFSSFATSPLLTTPIPLPPKPAAPVAPMPTPVVTAPIIGPRTLEQLTDSLKAVEITLTDEENARLDEIFPGPGGEAPQAYAW